MTAVKRAARALLGPSSYDEVEVARKLLPSTGLMLDVGAHQGYAHRPFVATGWRVIALEPDPANRAYLEAAPHDRVTIDPRAVSASDGEVLTLYTSEISSGISSLSSFHPSHRAGAQVESVRLDTLLASCNVTRVDFLKIDTEGHDLTVLLTFPWERMKPDVVVCEFEDRKTEPLGHTYREIGEFLIDKGYSVLMSEWFPVVEYGQEHTWRRVVRYPSDLLDSDGWGNFIAVRPDRAAHALRVAKLAGAQLACRRAIERRIRRR